MKNDYLLRFDEINRLEFGKSFEELCDDLYKEMYNAFCKGYGRSPDFSIEEYIFLLYDGKDVFDLLGEAFEDKDEERMKTIFSNEYHRMYNTGLYEGAKGKYKYKTWLTMLDDKVRDSHSYLEGIKIPINAEFITGNDKALFPGGFENAENNVNCRCTLKFS